MLHQLSTGLGSWGTTYPINVDDDENVECVCDGVECSGFDCYGCRDPDYLAYPDYDCTDVATKKPDSLVYQGKVPNFCLMGILCEKGMSSFA